MFEEQEQQIQSDRRALIRLEGEKKRLEKSRKLFYIYCMHMKYIYL